MSPSQPQQRLIIVGGGPSGALLALYLAHRSGFKIDLFEALPESRISGPTARSWNVVVSPRGSRALRAGGVDLHEEAGELAITLIGSMSHHTGKTAPSHVTGSDSICRGHLACLLLRKASKMPNVTVHFECTFTKVDMERRVATFERGNGEVVEREYDMLVGADGVHSRVRNAIKDNVPDFTVEQRQDHMAFKTFVLPVMEMEGADESWKEVLHISNSKVGCLIAPPRSDGMLTVVIILPSKGDTSFGALMKNTEDVQAFFARHYPCTHGPDGPNEQFAKEFLERRPQQQWSTYCSRLAHGRIVLIGDAGHSMWASLGQGLNAALEDCRVFAEVLDAETEGKEAAQAIDVPKLLEAYNERRLEDVLAACELSEEALGGSRTMRPAFAAQLFLMVILNKTLGLVAPKIFTPPSLMDINTPERPYGDIMRGVKREAVATKGLLLVTATLAAAGLARKFLVKR